MGSLPSQGPRLPSALLTSRGPSKMHPTLGLPLFSGPHQARQPQPLVRTLAIPPDVVRTPASVPLLPLFLTPACPSLFLRPCMPGKHLYISHTPLQDPLLREGKPHAPPL